MMKDEYITTSERETEAVGAALARALREKGMPYAFVAFYGEMGVGKTAFTRGFCRELGVTDVHSPTYTVVNEYPAKIPVYHFDMYRIDDEDSLYSIGYYDYLENGGICFAEWCEKIEPYLPEHFYCVTIRKSMEDPNIRRILITEEYR